PGIARATGVGHQTAPRPDSAGRDEPGPRKERPPSAASEGPASTVGSGLPRPTRVGTAAPRPDSAGRDEPGPTKKRPPSAANEGPAPPDPRPGLSPAGRPA